MCWNTQQHVSRLYADLASVEKHACQKHGCGGLLMVVCECLHTCFAASVVIQCPYSACTMAKGGSTSACIKVCTHTSARMLDMLTLACNKTP